MKNWLYALTACLILVNVLIIPIPSVWLIAFTAASVFSLGFDVTTRLADAMVVSVKTKDRHSSEQINKLENKVNNNLQEDEVVFFERPQIGLTTQYTNTKQPKEVIDLEDNDLPKTGLARAFAELTPEEQKELMEHCFRKNSP